MDLWLNRKKDGSWMGLWLNRKKDGSVMGLWLDGNALPSSVKNSFFTTVDVIL